MSALEHDPVNIAERLFLARAQWRHDNTQPRDLDALLLRAAVAFQHVVPSFWRTFAVIEAVLLLIVGIYTGAPR